MKHCVPPVESLGVSLMAIRVGRRMGRGNRRPDARQSESYFDAEQCGVPCRTNEREFYDSNQDDGDDHASD